MRISIGGMIGVALACAFRFALAAEGTVETSRVRGVGGARVAIYAATNSVRDVVAWLPSGSELGACEEWSDESVWLRVVPPESVSVWIYRELVAEGAVTADKSRVRAGAGLNYKPVASLRKGDRIEVRGAYGDWLKIKPPSGLSFWVLRNQVEPLAVMPPDEAATNGPVEGLLASLVTNVFPSGVSATNEAVFVPPAPVPVELAGAALAEAQDQGVPVTLTGLLDFGGVGEVSAPFSLVTRGAEGDEPVCLLYVRAADAATHVGETVAVSGTRWRLKGIALPVVIADVLRAP